MKTVTIASQKGGVGKTTTALALAHGLRRKGISVLLIDMDGQGNLSSSVEEQGCDVISFLKGADPEDGLVRSSDELFLLDRTLTGHGRERLLRERLEQVTGYDYCVIDSPPSFSLPLLMALAAADSVIIPVQADCYSLAGLEQIGSTIAGVRERYSPGLEILGILVTRYSSRQTLSKLVVASLEERAEAMGTRVFQTRIREAVAVKESQLMRRDIYTYAPRSNGARDCLAFTEEVLQRIGDKEDTHES